MNNLDKLIESIEYGIYESGNNLNILIEMVKLIKPLEEALEEIKNCGCFENGVMVRTDEACMANQALEAHNKAKDTLFPQEK